MKTEAERVADLADNDGELFPTRFTDALDKARNALSESCWTRYEFSDGSAIVTNSQSGSWSVGIHRDRIPEAEELMEKGTILSAERNYDDEKAPEDWVVEFLPPAAYGHEELEQPTKEDTQ